MRRRYISVFLSNEPAKPGSEPVEPQQLTTFDPRSLSPHNFRDISHQKIFVFPGTKRTSIHYERRRIEGKSFYTTFPDNTKGFLYYWTHPDLPPTSGQIRFRITNTKNPQDFDRGRDFCLPSGIPWHMTLAHLAGKKPYAGVCDILVRDGLVTRDAIEKLRSCSESVRLMPRQATVITSPDEVFPICLPLLNPTVYLAAAGESKQVRKIRIEFRKNEKIYNFIEPGKQVFTLVQFVYPEKYARNDWVPRLRIAHVYATDGPVTTGVPSSIKPRAMYPRRDFIAWCKEFNQA